MGPYDLDLRRYCIASRKVGYGSHYDAIDAKESMRLAGRDVCYLVMYFCPDCKDWHLGNDRYAMGRDSKRAERKSGFCES